MNAVVPKRTGRSMDSGVVCQGFASGFRSGGWKDEDLKGAVEIYDGPADLLANYESSIIGQETGDE